MSTEQIVANVVKFFFLITSPVTFLVGIFLLFDVNTYMRLEKFLSRDIDFRKRKLIGELNKQREMLQMFLLRWRRIIGIICLANSIIAVIFTNLYILRKY